MTSQLITMAGLSIIGIVAMMAVVLLIRWWIECATSGRYLESFVYAFAIAVIIFGCCCGAACVTF